MKPLQTSPLSVARRSRHAWLAALITSGPGFLWQCLFVIGPLLIVLAVSFLTRGPYGSVEFPFTLENYKRFLGFGLLGFDPLYPTILLRSVLLGAATAFICAVLALPLAFFIARLPARSKSFALVLVVIPFWTNLLIRTYAWQILLAPDSWLSAAARALGLLGANQGVYPGMAAVLVGMVCDFLPFLVLPLYASVEKIDWQLAEAARDLGAHGLQVFRHALLPQIKPGLVAGAVLVFLPATGQFVIPDLLGGARIAMLGNAIQQQFGQSRNWPFGSAVATASLLIMCLGFWLWISKTKRKNREEA